MTESQPRPVWNRDERSFFDRTTGERLDISVAAPRLTAAGGAFRDALGRFVPHSALGGIVLTEAPSGKADYVFLRREIPGRVEDWHPSDRDFLSAKISYTIAGERTEDIWATMPRGVSWNPVIAEDRIFDRIQADVRYRTGAEVDPFTAEDVEIEWTVGTFYRQGESLGEDFFRFER